MNNLLENYYNNKKIKTIIGKKTEFNGNLKFKDSLKINGLFLGNIESNGLLIIGQGALVQANIKANTIIVYGTIKGDVYADNKVELYSTGRIYGNIKARKIKISDGVIFNGKCEIIRNNNNAI